MVASEGSTVAVSESSEMVEDSELLGRINSSAEPVVLGERIAVTEALVTGVVRVPETVMAVAGMPSIHWHADQ